MAGISRYNTQRVIRLCLLILLCLAVATAACACEGKRPYRRARYARTKANGIRHPVKKVKDRGIVVRETQKIALSFEYLGPTDRPPLPLILATSQEAIGIFLKAHPRDQALRHGHQLVTSAAVLSSILTHLDAVERNSSLEVSPQDDLLAVHEWTGRQAKTTRLKGREAHIFLTRVRDALEKTGAGSVGALHTFIELVSKESSEPK